MENIKVNQEDILSTEASTLLTEAKQFVIRNIEQYKIAADELLRVKSIRKKINELMDPVIKKAHETHKEAVASKNKLTDPLDQAESSFKQSMLAYDREQQRIAAEAQAKARAEAGERARKEREALEAKALKAIEKGKEEFAEELISKAESVQAFVPIVEAETVKVSGISVKTTWKARVSNPQQVPAYFNGMEIRKIDNSQLDKIARMSNGTMQIPGIEFYEEKTMSASAR